MSAEIRTLRKQLRRLWKSYTFYVENGYPANANDCLNAIDVVEQRLGIYAEAYEVANGVRDAMPDGET